MVIVKDTKGGEFERLDAGSYSAVCVGVYDIGVQKSEYKGDIKFNDQMIITFQVSKKDSNGKRFLVNKFYTKSLFKKANLRKDLEGWRGKSFTEEELLGFDVDVLIGQSCLLSVIEKGDYANIASISTLPEGVPPIEPEGDFSEVPEWIKKIQAKAVVDTETEQLVGESVEDDVEVPF